MLPHIKNGRTDASYKRNTVPLKQLVTWANRELARTDGVASSERRIPTRRSPDRVPFGCP